MRNVKLTHYDDYRNKDVIFRKMTNRNQTYTNEIATAETKYQTDFILPKNANTYLTKY